MKACENMEKRTFERHDLEARIVCAYFNTNKYTQAKLLNYCEGGLCFESDIAFKPNASIYIRIEKLSLKASESSLHDGFRTTTIGEVKWCKAISVPEFYKFGVGVKYYELY